PDENKSPRRSLGRCDTSHIGPSVFWSDHFWQACAAFPRDYTHQRHRDRRWRIGGAPLGETGGGQDPGPVADTQAKSNGMQVTRRDFLIGAGAGAATAGAVLGGAIVVKNVVAPETAATKTNTSGNIPATMRRVS